jgi:hypothetical protein
VADDDLARVLILLHESAKRWRTLHAQGEEWADPEGTRAAFERMARPGSIVTSRGDGTGPSGRDRGWRVWVRQPDEVRAEFGLPHGYHHLVIANRQRVCQSHPEGGHRVTERRDEHDSWLGPAGMLIRPFALPAALEVRAVHQETFLGRRVLIVAGGPRTMAEPGRPDLLWAADEVRFAVDAERGVLLWLERRFEGQPFTRTSMTTVTFDHDLDDALFAVPEDDEGPLLVPPGPGRPPRPYTHPGPPDGVLGAPVSGTVFVAREPSFAIVVDALVAYPTGFELRLTVRTRDEPVRGSFGPGNRRSWSGNAAFPSQSLAARPTGDMALQPLSGMGTHARFDQWFWAEPLPAPGAVGLVVNWPGPNLHETRVELDGDAIREAATRAVTLWP